MSAAFLLAHIFFTKRIKVEMLNPARRFTATKKCAAPPRFVSYVVVNYNTNHNPNDSFDVSIRGEYYYKRKKNALLKNNIRMFFLQHYLLSS